MATCHGQKFEDSLIIDFPFLVCIRLVISCYYLLLFVVALLMFYWPSFGFPDDRKQCPCPPNFVVVGSPRALWGFFFFCFFFCFFLLVNQKTGIQKKKFQKVVCRSNAAF